MAQTVILQSSDAKEFTVSEACAVQSQVVQTLMKERESANEPIPLATVEGEVLAKAVEWLNYHAEHPHMYTEPPEDRNRLSPLNPWDIKFCDDLEKGLLFDLFKASIYLQVPMLIESCARCVARNLVGKTPEQMREYLNEPNEYTEEEIEELKKKFAH